MLAKLHMTDTQNYSQEMSQKCCELRQTVVFNPKGPHPCTFN